jgi:hypothetical protein
MLGELDVLKIVSDRLEAANVAFMLTGSFAMAYYGQPRMTRDLDLVVSLGEADVDRVVAALSPDFYIDKDDVLAAVRSERLFNLMHNASGIKIDLIVRKRGEYRQLEFSRRRRVVLDSVATWIVSREDLILSKLVWAKESQSELQLRDVRSLMDESVDRVYLERWARELGVEDTLETAGR